MTLHQLLSMREQIQQQVLRPPLLQGGARRKNNADTSLSEIKLKYYTENRTYNEYNESVEKYEIFCCAST